MPTTTTPSRAISDTVIDAVLSAQIAVAWAGEAGETTRLGWWKTDLMSEFGGEDLFKRLLPKTWDWAVVQGLREAARRHDAELRSKVHDPDAVISLYRLGFAVDERADERLLELKRLGTTPDVAFPAFAELVGASWARKPFEAWVDAHGDAKYEIVPNARQLKGALPGNLEHVVKSLVSALLPLVDQYPLPHYLRAR